MQARPLSAWLEHIEALHPNESNLGLDSVRATATRLNVLRPAPLVFVVAGTNGKGSVCEYLEVFCRSAGGVVGKATSPHLLSFNERIQINGVGVADADICWAFESIDRARGSLALTYFEFAALAAMVLFKQRQVDVAVLEIGLGGRLDAMNIIDADVAVISQIALDHQSWLGDTREQIAVEKAAIVRKGRYCVIADRSPPASLVEYVTKQGAIPQYIGQDFDAANDSGSADRPFPRLPADSAAAALRATNCAGIHPTASDVSQAITETVLPGRLQWLRREPGVLLDVAHNPAAAAYLRDYLQHLALPGQLHAVVGMYRDKQIAEVLRLFVEDVDVWHLTELDDERSATSGQLVAAIQEYGCQTLTYDKVAYAFDNALRNCASEDTIVVFGSFPVVAGVLRAARHVDTDTGA